MSSASRKLIQASGAVAGPADTGDDDFANVVLLLDGDGTSGDDNNTFTDSSTNTHTITRNGNVTQGSFSPYGDNWSNYFDGSSSLKFNSSGDYNLGVGDFTIEGWFYKTASTASQTIVSSGSYYTAGANGNWVLRITSATQIAFATYNGTGNEEYSEFSAATSLNTWHHFALVREGTGTNQTKFYLDGVLAGSMTVSKSLSDGSVNGIYIGSDGAGPNNDFNGYLSNVRILTATALYTSGFTPPTSPLTTISNTEFLSAASNRFIDEAIGGTITISGTPKVTPFSPFKDDDARDITTDGGSAYIVDGDWLTMPDDSVFVLAGQDFTFECWVYRTDYSTGSGTIYSRWQGSPYAGLRLGVNTTGVAYFYNITTLYGTPTGTVRKNEWTHIAWIYDATGASSGNVTIYVNGEVALNTTAVSGGVSDASTNTDVYVGTLNVYPTQGELHGYLSDFRFVRGTLLYTSAFTPPTAPLTAITNTELLLNFQDAGIYDRTGLNNLDTVGNAQIDTAVKKYGTGSMEFDGTGDYLDTVSTEALTFGTGDFTIEFWINTSNNGNIMNPSTATGSGYWGLLMQSGNLRWNNSYAVTNLWQISASAIQDGSWHHVAISRASGSTKIFYDGTLQSTQADTTNYSGTGAWRIGSGNLAAFNGYLDDFRITNGVARYTANFTAPDAELPKF
jgi:hypothetical protein